MLIRLSRGEVLSLRIVYITIDFVSGSLAIQVVLVESEERA